MSRSFMLLVLSLSPLVSPSATADSGGFRKQIVVYLDSSGTMLPESRNPEDPFQKTLEALKLFLREPEFVEAEDSITVATFGGQVASKREWTGAANPSLEFAAISRDFKAETDFAAVFDHLEDVLDPRADRRLVIIASDFIQEPRARGETPGSSLASWQELASSRLPRLQQLFGNDRKQILLLFKAPVRDDRRQFLPIRESIVKDLRDATVADDFDIGAGGLNASGLARQIRKKLLFELEVDARLDTEGKQIQVTVTNPNGLNLELGENFRVTCLDEQGRDQGDAASVAIPRSERQLGASGTASSTRTLPPLPVRLDCLDKATSYRVEVVTREGSEGAVTVSTRSWIVHRVADAQVEKRFLQTDLLRLYLGLRGHGEPGNRFQLNLYLNGSSTTKSPLTSATFVTPTELTPFDDQLFLLTLSVPQGTSRDFHGERAIRVEIDSVAAEGAGRRNDGASAANLLLRLAWPSLLLGSCVLFVKRRKRNQSSVTVLGTVQELTSYSVGALGLALADLLRRLQLQNLPLLADWLRLLALLVTPFLVYFFVRTYLGYRLDQRFAETDPPMTPEELLNLIRGTRSATIAAFLTLVAIVSYLCLSASWPIDSTAAIPVVVTQ